jgi:uncharacterized protein YerC
MVRINKKYLSGELKKEIWEAFFGALRKANSGGELKAALNKFLTSSEIALLEKRLGIKSLLKKGWKYRDIQGALDVTRVTISFVKKGLRRAKRRPRRYSASSLPKRRRKSFLPPRGRGRWNFLNSS